MLGESVSICSKLIIIDREIKLIFHLKYDAGNLFSNKIVCLHYVQFIHCNDAMVQMTSPDPSSAIFLSKGVTYISRTALLVK